VLSGGHVGLRLTGLRDWGRNRHLYYMIPSHLRQARRSNSDKSPVFFFVDLI